MYQRTELRHPKARSTMSNGRLLRPGTDTRTHKARRLRDLVAIFEQQATNLNAANRLLIRRAAALVILCEELDQKLSQDGVLVDATTYAKITGQLARLLSRLGLGKVQGPAFSSLDITDASVDHPMDHAVSVSSDDKQRKPVARRRYRYVDDDDD